MTASGKSFRQIVTTDVQTYATDSMNHVAKLRQIFCTYRLWPWFRPLASAHSVLCAPGRSLLSTVALLLLLPPRYTESGCRWCAEPGPNVFPGAWAPMQQPRGPLFILHQHELFLSAGLSLFPAPPCCPHAPLCRNPVSALYVIILAPIETRFYRGTVSLPALYKSM